MIKKIFISTVLIAFIALVFFGFSQSALAAKGKVTGVNPPKVHGIDITTVDLGAENPGLLPTSRWYFLKEWRRDIQRLFTFNKVAKTRLEIRITNEKAAELFKIQENKSVAASLVPPSPPPPLVGCQPGWHEFLAGIDDQFALPTEPAIPSPGLQLFMNQYQGQSHRDFDETGKNKFFGHTFTGVVPDPAQGAVEEASLELRIRPNTWTGNTYAGSPGIPSTDAIGLTFFDDNGNPLATGWSRRLGLDIVTNTPGLFSGQWLHTHPAELLELNLDVLPNADGSTSSLIQAMSVHDLLDVYVQDDTIVDYIKLRVRHSCLPLSITPVREPLEPITPACTRDVWECSSWSECSPAGTQTRRCTLETDCPAVETPKPADQQTCAPPPTCVGQGQACGVATSCCEGECNAAGICAVTAPACAQVGALCSAATPCCNGLICASSGFGYLACQEPSPPPSESPDLKAEKLLGSAFHFGQSASYTIQVENIGSGVAKGQIIVTDELPDGLTYLSFSSPYSTDWSCTASGQKVTCVYNGPNVSPGGFLPALIINVTIASAAQFPAMGDQVVNCAIVEHPSDTKTDNNQSCVTTIVTSG